MPTITCRCVGSASTRLIRETIAGHTTETFGNENFSWQQFENAGFDSGSGPGIFWSDTQTALFQFDVSQALIFGNVVSAILVLGSASSNPTGLNSITVESLVRTSGTAIVENAVTANNFHNLFASVPSSQRISATLSGVQNVAGGHVRSADITQIFSMNRVHANIVSFRLTASNLPGFISRAGRRATASSIRPILILEMSLQPGVAPTNLLPSTTQNPNQAIRLNWRHARDSRLPAGADDPQTGSEVRYRQGTSGNWTTVSGGMTNEFTVPARTFSTTGTVQFQARTRTRYNDWGAWSAISSFGLAVSPPLAPTNLLPTAVQNPRLLIRASWRHNPNAAMSTDVQTNSEARFRQGTGAWRTFNGGTANQAELPANTFTALTNVEFQARAYTAINGWGAWSASVIFPLAISPPLAPTNLSPTISQNPRGAIRASWLHSPNPAMAADVQINSEARFRQGTGAWRTFNGGAINQAVLPAHTFTTYARVEFQARTYSTINGWGAWSSSAFFNLAETPPHAPTLIFPVNVSTRAVDGAFLEWTYNSPYDIFPSRFDIRYRIDGSEWIDLRNNSVGNIPAGTSTRTRPELSQRRAEWQVRAWGELGDVGPWSDIASFFIIGTPPPPTITTITNSGRPEIHFSAQNLMSWEVEILNQGKVIYNTGIRAFEGIFKHAVNQLIPNGNYLARLRIANEFGILSEWTTLAFTVAVQIPNVVELRTANNLKHSTKLWFDCDENIGNTTYIYRAEFDSDDFACIAKAADSFEDWTVQPGQRYKYFIRNVGPDFGFSDSKIHSAKANKFLETTIAYADTPWDMLKLMYQLGGKPDKNSTFQQEKALSKFAGRTKPVLQLGTHLSRKLNLAFHMSLSEKDVLEQFAESGKALILRDWRLGVVIGTISGQVQATGDGISDGCQVSFTFEEIDYSIETDR